jgi:hypothetical protein
MWLRISSTLRQLPLWQLVFLALFALIVVLTAIGPVLATLSTTNTSRPTYSRRAAHWLGTDDNGIDILLAPAAAPSRCPDRPGGDGDLGPSAARVVALYESRGVGPRSPRLPCGYWRSSKRSRSLSLPWCWSPYSAELK